MKKRAEAMAFIIAVAMILACFSGCGKKDVETSTGILTGEEISKFEKKAGGLKLPFATDGTKITVFVTSSEEKLSEKLIIKELSRRTGLDIQVNGVPSSALNEKVSTLIASKNLPDIFHTDLSVSRINDLGHQGAFESVSAHADELPNFKKIFIDDAEKLKTDNIMKQGTDAKGELYQFPSYNITPNVNYGILYRKDLFDKNGLKMWTNQQEFYESMKKLKEIYPDSIPFSGYLGSKMFYRLMPMWGIQQEQSGVPVCFNYETDQFESAYSCDRMKDMFNFLNKLYKEGILDSEFLTRTANSWTQEMSKEHTIFASWGWMGKMDILNSSSTVDGYDLRYAYPIGPTGTIEPRSEALYFGASIKKSKNSLLALKVCDYLLSEGGAELMTCGIEGETFNVDKDGKVVYVGYEDTIPDWNDLTAKYGMFIEGFKFRTDPRSCYFQYDEREQEAQDLMMNKPGGGFNKQNPSVKYSESQIEEFNKNSADIQTAFEEFGTKYIISNTSTEKDWEEYKSDLNKKYNIDHIVEEVNKLYKEQYK